MSVATGSSDTIIRRLQQEFDDKRIFAEGILERANAANRDLSQAESEQLVETRGRMEALESQMNEVQATFKVAYEGRNRARDIGMEIEKLKGTPMTGEVEYRSSGEYIFDMYNAAMGSREAGDRLESFERAAAHQKTSDNPGIIPTPIIGEVINFIDAARPLTNALGVRSLPGQNWSRPRVTAHTSVALQGAAGAQADEKSELVSQKMTISKINAVAQTYGGYVNVSKQNIDFGINALDVVVNDLAAQYAIQTEAATAAAVNATGTTAVGYTATPTPTLVATALWKAAGQVYAAVKGQGSLILVVSPDVLGTFGPLFAPVNPQTAQSTGMLANAFGQGSFGMISGITGLMSAGLGTGKAFLLSTAALEVYEQRIGTLQVVEPSVLGFQVAYAGYFTPVTIETAAIVPLTAT